MGVVGLAAVAALLAGSLLPWGRVPYPSSMSDDDTGELVTITFHLHTLQVCEYDLRHNGAVVQCDDTRLGDYVELGSWYALTLESVGNVVSATLVMLALLVTFLDLFLPVVPPRNLRQCLAVAWLLWTAVVVSSMVFVGIVCVRTHTVNTRPIGGVVANVGLGLTWYLLRHRYPRRRNYTE